MLRLSFLILPLKTCIDGDRMSKAHSIPKDIYINLLLLTLYTQNISVCGMDKMRKPICVLLIALLIGTVGPVPVTAKETVLILGSTTVLPLAESGAEAFNGGAVELHSSCYWR